MNPGGKRGGKSTAPAGAAVQPPKPSGMKVNLFQQASREARYRISSGIGLNQDRLRRLQRQPEAQMASDDGGRKNIKGTTAQTRAMAFRRGSATQEMFAPNRPKAGYRAPATRLY